MTKKTEKEPKKKDEVIDFAPLEKKEKEFVAALEAFREDLNQAAAAAYREARKKYMSSSGNSWIDKAAADTVTEVLLHSDRLCNIDAVSNALIRERAELQFKKKQQDEKKEDKKSKK